MGSVKDIAVQKTQVYRTEYRLRKSSYFARLILRSFREGINKQTENKIGAFWSVAFDFRRAVRAMRAVRSVRARARRSAFRLERGVCISHTLSILFTSFIDVPGRAEELAHRAAATAALAASALPDLSSILQRLAFLGKAIKLSHRGRKECV